MSVTRVSSQTSPVVDRVTSLVAPIVTDLGLDLYDIEYTGGIVRIVVDTQPGGQAGVKGAADRLYQGVSGLHQPQIRSPLP